MPPLVLRGQVVHLRPPQAGDYADWARVRGENALRLKPFEPRWADGALKEDFFLKRLHRQANDWMNDRNYAFLIFQDTTLIGGVNVNNVCRGAAHFASIGYWIDEAVEGRGLMFDALQTLNVYAFDHLRLHRINAATLPDNARSQKLLERLGFMEEGRAQKYLQIDGVWRDHILFGKWQDMPKREVDHVDPDH